MYPNEIIVKIHNFCISYRLYNKITLPIIQTRVEKISDQIFIAEKDVAKAAYVWEQNILVYFIEVGHLVFIETKFVAAATAAAVFFAAAAAAAAFLLLLCCCCC